MLQRGKVVVPCTSQRAAMVQLWDATIFVQPFTTLMLGRDTMGSVHHLGDVLSHLAGDQQVSFRLSFSSSHNSREIDEKENVHLNVKKG